MPIMPIIKLLEGDQISVQLTETDQKVPRPRRVQLVCAPPPAAPVVPEPGPRGRPAAASGSGLGGHELAGGPQAGQAVPRRAEALRAAAAVQVHAVVGAAAVAHPALVRVDAELLVGRRDLEPLSAGAREGAVGVVAAVLAAPVIDKALVVIHAQGGVVRVDGPALGAAAVIRPVDVEAQLLTAALPHIPVLGNVRGKSHDS